MARTSLHTSNGKAVTLSKLVFWWYPRKGDGRCVSWEHDIGCNVFAWLGSWLVMSCAGVLVLAFSEEG